MKTHLPFSLPSVLFCLQLFLSTPPFPLQLQFLTRSIHISWFYFYFYFLPFSFFLFCSVIVLHTVCLFISSLFPILPSYFSLLSVCLSLSLSLPSCSNYYICFNNLSSPVPFPSSPPLPRLLSFFSPSYPTHTTLPHTLILIHPPGPKRTQFVREMSVSFGSCGTGFAQEN